MTAINTKSRNKFNKTPSGTKKSLSKPTPNSNQDKSAGVKNPAIATKNKPRLETNTNKKTASATKPSITKQSKIITLLQRQKGATVAELSKITGWQDHSIRGFMSGTLKKRMGLDVVSEKNGRGTRRYRINNSDDTTPTPVKPESTSSLAVTGRKKL